MNKVLIFIVVVVAIFIGRFAYLANQTDNSELQLSDNSHSSAQITVMDILNASDLREGIKQSVQENDDAMFGLWLEKAYEVAAVAGLSHEDQDYLRSAHCHNFLRFTAQRDLFNEEFERRYYLLEPVDDLFDTYPQAKDLFDNAKSLIKKRNTLIFAIAVELTGTDQPSAQQVEQAKQLWIERQQADNG